jgi:hypothetical protein
MTKFLPADATVFFLVLAFVLVFVFVFVLALVSVLVGLADFFTVFFEAVVFLTVAFLGFVVFVVVGKLSSNRIQVLTEAA